MVLPATPSIAFPRNLAFISFEAISKLFTKKVLQSPTRRIDNCFQNELESLVLYARVRDKANDLQSKKVPVTRKVCHWCNEKQIPAKKFERFLWLFIPVSINQAAPTIRPGLSLCGTFRDSMENDAIQLYEIHFDQRLFWLKSLWNNSFLIGTGDGKSSVSLSSARLSLVCFLFVEFFSFAPFESRIYAQFGPASWASIRLVRSLSVWSLPSLMRTRLESTVGVSTHN